MSGAHRGLRRAGIALVAAATLVLTAAGAAGATTAKVHIVTSFDEGQGQNTEGVAVDRWGNVYVSVSFLGDLWKIPAGSTTPEPFGHVEGISTGDFGLLGLAVDDSGNVYGGVQSANPDANGVWRFDHETGDATRLAGSQAIGVANGLTFDHAGNLYVADSTGIIWRIRPGGKAKVWLQDPALTGDGSLGLGIGANGIAFADHVFTVANTERRTILHIAKVNGQAGPVHVFTTLPENPDGVALDVEGNTYVALNFADEIGMLSPTGGLSVLASGDRLDFPSSIAFSPKRGDRRMLFGVNFSIGDLFFGQPSGSGPALWWLRAPARGARVG